MTPHLVVVAAFDGVELLDVAGPLEVFSAADRLLGKDVPGYRTLVAGPEPGLVRCAGGTSIAADISWTDLHPAVGTGVGTGVPTGVGTLIVPGGLAIDATGATALRVDPLVAWLATPAARGTPRIASVCGGAHLLAAAGLLDGRRATTHWATADRLAADHPEVTVEPDAIFVRDGHIWTSAGVSTGMDLALALVADDHNAELARRIARWLVMYLRRPGGQSQFSELLAHSSATDSRPSRTRSASARSRHCTGCSNSASASRPRPTGSVSPHAGRDVAFGAPATSESSGILCRPTADRRGGAMGVWHVLAESDREQWIYRPSVGVGPLRFGMSPEEAVAALDGFTGTVHDGPGLSRNDREGLFRRATDPVYETAVSVFFGEPEGLFCVVADARRGPQVTLDGIRLVGRTPSQWETDLLGYLSSHGMTPRYAPGGDPGADELGLIVAVQRAGDVVLTRPAMLIERECAYTLWDALPRGEGTIR